MKIFEFDEWAKQEKEITDNLVKSVFPNFDQDFMHFNDVITDLSDEINRPFSIQDSELYLRMFSENSSNGSAGISSPYASSLNPIDIKYLSGKLYTIRNICDFERVGKALKGSGYLALYFRILRSGNLTSKYSALDFLKSTRSIQNVVIRHHEGIFESIKTLPERISRETNLTLLKNKISYSWIERNSRNDNNYVRHMVRNQPIDDPLSLRITSPIITRNVNNFYLSGISMIFVNKGDENGYPNIGESYRYLDGHYSESGQPIEHLWSSIDLPV